MGLSMKRIGSLADLEPFPAAITPANWTALIPAAGRGTRLDHPGPKVLFPVLGRPLIEWMIELLRPYCARFVVVLAPTEREVVAPAIARLLPSDAYRIALQHAPNGMADAIDQARDLVATPHVLVTWGDQITLRPETVARCMRAHEHRPGALLTLPTLVRPEPYIHFQRDADDRLVAVLQAREGEIDQPVGESDAGLFLFATSTLFSLLREARQNFAPGRATREFNLLPLLPLFELGPGSVMSLRILDDEETLGVNTRAEGDRAAAILRRRGEPV